MKVHALSVFSNSIILVNVFTVGLQWLIEQMKF